MVIKTKIINEEVFYTQEDKNRIQKFIIANNNKKVVIKLEKDTRSLKQNRLYWLFMSHCVKQGLGSGTAEQNHEAFKQLFLTQQFITIGDKEIITTKSTKKLKVNEFILYFEQCLQFAGENGVDVDEFIRELKNK